MLNFKKHCSGARRVFTVMAAIALSTAGLHVQAQTAPAALVCPAGTEKFTFDVTSQGTGATQWPDNATAKSFNVTLPTSGRTLTIDLGWTNIYTGRAGTTTIFNPEFMPRFAWSTAGTRNAGPSVNMGFRTASGNLLATHTIGFSLPVSNLRYVIYDVDINGTSYQDQVQAIGATQVYKWGAGYSAVSPSTSTASGTYAGDTLYGRSTQCTQPCTNANATAIYNNTFLTSASANYTSLPVSNNGNNSVQFAGFNNYEGCVALPPSTASLTLIKRVTNGYGGTATASQWTLTATGPTAISGATGTAAVTNASVNPGTYTLGETGGVAGYTMQTYSCIKNGGAPVVGNSITLAGGDTATCTVQNVQNAPVGSALSATCPAGTTKYWVGTGTAPTDAAYALPLSWSTGATSNTFTFADPSSTTMTVSLDGIVNTYNGVGVPPVMRAYGPRNWLQMWHDDPSVTGVQKFHDLSISVSKPVAQLYVTTADIDALNGIVTPAAGGTEYYRDQVTVNNGGTVAAVGYAPYYSISGNTIAPIGNIDCGNTGYTGADPSYTNCNVLVNWSAVPALSTRSLSYYGAFDDGVNNPTIQWTGYNDFTFCVADAQLAVTKTNNGGTADATSDTVTTGSKTTYTIVATNNGPAAANNATVFDTPGAGLSSCAVKSCAVTNGAGTCPAAGTAVAAGGTAFTIAIFPANSSMSLQVECTVN